MPLPDVDATLQEIAYAYDTLNADGIALFTSYGDTLARAPVFRPVMAELHRRKAVVHVHPTAANCCRNLGYAPGVGARRMEYGTDTTRAIIGVDLQRRCRALPRYPLHLVARGRHRRRFSPDASTAGRATPTDRLPSGFTHEARRFHYDLAGATNPGAVASLLQLVSSAQILFGTDFPPGGSSSDVAKALASLTLLHEADCRAIERDNALRLFPRLRR